MTETEYAKKMDSCGRIVFPSKLREEMNLEVGEIYPIFTHQEGKKRYVCIQCPDAQTEVEKALEVLAKNGIQIEISENK